MWRLIGCALSASLTAGEWVCGEGFAKAADHRFTTLSFDPAQIKEGDTLYLRTQFVDLFFDQIEPHINCRYILITHNSDHNLDQSHLYYLDRPNLYHWFAQNCVGLAGKKVTPIPIGIMNPIHYKGIENHFSKVKRDKKLFLVSYLGCKVRHIEERRRAQAYFQQLEGCYFSEKRPFLDYLQDLSRSYFVVCPEGAGFDTHRCWESLIMGAIPIVKHSAMDPLFADLPVWLIDDWGEVHRQSMRQAYRHLRFVDGGMKKLTMLFWREKIKEVQRQCRGK